jgi:tRNA-splicing ligase RtcB
LRGELFDETCLSDARLAADHHDARFAGTRPVQNVAEHGKFRGATDHDRADEAGPHDRMLARRRYSRGERDATGYQWVMDVIGGARLPVHTWAPDLEAGARRQALNCASLPVAYHHVAVMADGHQGYGVPIGAVLALDEAISPYAVGNDIGCGMAIVPTTIERAATVAARDDIMRRVQAAVPSGMASHREPVIEAAVDARLNLAFDALEAGAAASGLRLSTSQSASGRGGKPLTRADFVARGRAQVGTLGSGNHFVEFLTGPDDDVWVMLHSGSRGIGGLVCNNFHRMALASCEQHGEDLVDEGLAWLPLPRAHDGDAGDRWAAVGRAYEHALRNALEYARHNRHRMLLTVAEIVEQRFPGSFQWDGMVNIHHNDATLEEHFGARVWVHRKGAVKASKGTPTITPGSMGSGSYLGRGLGNPDSFESCSHGAGRARSRSKARAELDLRRELASITDAGGKVYASNTEAVLDEMPGAYKDLDGVMANQSDLVEPVRRFTPIATYKGADPPKHRARKDRAGTDRARTWRPEEER